MTIEERLAEVEQRVEEIVGLIRTLADEEDRPRAAWQRYREKVRAWKEGRDEV